MLRHVRLFVTTWTVACQPPLSMGFPRQEYWSVLPFSSPGDLPDPGIKLGSPSLQTDSLLSEPPGKSQSSICLAVLFFNRKLKSVYLSFGFVAFFPHIRGFPGGSDSKEFACNAGHPGLIPGSGRSPGEGNSNPLQYSCLENSMDRGSWQATVHSVTKSQT